MGFKLLYKIPRPFHCPCQGLGQLHSCRSRSAAAWSVTSSETKRRECSSDPPEAGRMSPALGVSSGLSIPCTFLCHLLCSVSIFVPAASCSLEPRILPLIPCPCYLQAIFPGGPGRPSCRPRPQDSAPGPLCVDTARGAQIHRGWQGGKHPCLGVTKGTAREEPESWGWRTQLGEPNTSILESRLRGTLSHQDKQGARSSAPAAPGVQSCAGDGCSLLRRPGHRTLSPWRAVLLHLPSLPTRGGHSALGCLTAPGLSAPRHHLHPP